MNRAEIGDPLTLLLWFLAGVMWLMGKIGRMR